MPEAVGTFLVCEIPPVAPVALIVEPDATTISEVLGDAPFWPFAEVALILEPFNARIP